MTPESPIIPRAEGAAPGQPIRPARRSRLSWLRALPLLTRPTARTTPWVTMITGCLAGTVYLAVMAHVAGASHSPLGQGTVRLAFLPRSTTAGRAVVVAAPAPGRPAVPGPSLMFASVAVVRSVPQVRRRSARKFIAATGRPGRGGGRRPGAIGGRGAGRAVCFGYNSQWNAAQPTLAEPPSE